MLASSHGADDSAVWAGFPVGWSAHGSRSLFDVVTGVSTGGPMACFAFLGSERDDALEALYTCTSLADLFPSPSLVDALLGDALADSSPLRRLIATYTDEALLRAIACEHRRGRALYVVTTNLDWQRPVLWDLSAMAVEAEPARALKLFRSVLLASASISGLLPPVLVEVEGTVGRTRPGRTLYALINNRLEPEFEIVPRRTLAVAGKAFSITLRSFTPASLASAYAFSQRNGIAFRLAAIGPDFPPGPSGAALLDTAYTGRLFAYGRARGEALAFDPVPEGGDRPAAGGGIGRLAGARP